MKINFVITIRKENMKMIKGIERWNLIQNMKL